MWSSLCIFTKHYEKFGKNHMLDTGFYEKYGKNASENFIHIIYY